MPRNPYPTHHDFLNAAEWVLTELARYRGGKIIKGKHPLHKAVVALEKCCRKRVRKPMPGVQSHGLIPPADRCWYALLDASRGNQRCVWGREGKRDWFLTTKDVRRLLIRKRAGQPDKGAARELTGMLTAILRTQIAFVRLAARPRDYRGLLFTIKRDKMPKWRQPRPGESS